MENSSNDFNKSISTILSDSSDDEQETVIEPSKNFQPKPYLFELVNKDTGKPITLAEESINNRRVSCPDYHVLFDHTIACLWTLYSDEIKTDKILPTQLQWAIKFLQEINFKAGQQVHSNDIGMAIKHMEDLTVALYNLVKDDDILVDGELDEHIAKEFESSSDNYFPTSITLNDMFENEPETLEKLMEKKKETSADDSLNTTGGRSAAGKLRGTIEEIEALKKKYRDEQYERIESEILRLKNIDKLLQHEDQTGSMTSLGFSEVLDRLKTLVDQTKT